MQYILTLQKSGKTHFCKKIKGLFEHFREHMVENRRNRII